MTEKYCGNFEKNCAYLTQDGKCVQTNISPSEKPCPHKVDVSDPAQKLVIKYVRCAMQQTQDMLDKLVYKQLMKTK